MKKIHLTSSQGFWCKAKLWKVLFEAMITGIFEEAFSGREAKEKLRKRWWNRTGMVAAYCLLDRDYDTVSKIKYQTENQFQVFEYVTQSEFVVNTNNY